MPAPTPLDVDIGPGLRLWDHGGEGPTVLFLHGYLDTGRSYDAVAAGLSGVARCLCLDWRGHGGSGWAGPAGSYHLLDHLKDLSRLVDALAPGGSLAALGPLALVVAHSMGGNVALLLAGSRPHAVPRLLLVDALGAPAEAPDEQPERLQRLLESLGPPRPFKTFPDRAGAEERVMATNPGLSREGAARMVEHALVDTVGGVTFAFDPGLRGPVPMRYPEAFWTALCSRVVAPTRVLRAEGDYVPEGSPATERVAAMRSGRMVTVPGVGHHLHVEAVSRLAEEVRELLAEPLAAG